MIGLKCLADKGCTTAVDTVYEADKSMILQLEADELIPYSEKAETGNATETFSVPSVKIYPKYTPELFSPSYLYDIIQILKPSHGVIKRIGDDSEIKDTEIHLSLRLCTAEIDPSVQREDRQGN